jgi:outer membrane lipoprotein-sorting protein
MVSKNTIYFFIATAIATSSLAGCGGDRSAITGNTPIVYNGQVYYPEGTAPATDPSDCCCVDDGTETEDDSDTTPVTSKTAAPSKSPTPGASKTPEPTKTATPVSTANDAKVKGRKILDKVLATITTPNALEVEVEKWEKGLKEDRTVEQRVKVQDKKPGKVKMEILYHTKASSIGAKITFNTSTGKATIRPGGALSFITKEMDQTDSNLTSPNGFTPEQIDFFYISKRLGDPSYNAELIGKTTLNGSEIYLLKITKNGTNELLADIDHEIMGFDLKTFEVKSWELYTAKSNDAFMRVIIKSFKALTDLPDSTFKV